MSHTPGPWYIAGHLVIAYSADGKAPTVAQVLDDDNARLIAAAPELLDALKLIDSIAIKHEKGAAGRMQKVARQAIAKATGEA